MKYVVVGGVAGGATAAARLRRIDEKVEIVLFEKVNYISYANCGLPYYIGGVIEDRSKLFVQTPQAFSKRFNIDIRVASQVVSIDRANKKVSVRTADGKEYEESYDKLLLSPGAKPSVPPIPGIYNEFIFTLRNVSDTDKIKNYITTHEVKNAVIIGAGFIGLEMAENLHEAGAHVSIVEMTPQVMAPIDFSMASIVHQHLIEKGGSLYLEKTVVGFTKREGGGVKVLLKSGEVIETDLVLLSIGVKPNNELAVAAGLEIGGTKGIKVNEYLQTSDDDIYAVGDAIEFPHPLTGKPWLNYLAGPANRQARIVADNMIYGNKTKYEGAIGTSIAKVFDMTVAITGIAAKRLGCDSIEYMSATVHPNSHAGYYPDAFPLSLKLTFDKNSGKVYSVQAVGYDGVDKRIDVASQIIKRGGTIYDIIEIEQAYAPPFSSAKDPLALAGYVATNILEKRMCEIDSSKPIWLYCGVGLRGYLASNILLRNGFTNVRNLVGGLKTYKSSTAELPVPANIYKTFKYSEEKRFQIDNLRVTELYKEDGDDDKTASSIKIDACGLSCPGPLMKLKKNMEVLKKGDILEVTATDAGFPSDARSWAETTGNEFICSPENAG